MIIIITRSPKTVLVIIYKPLYYHVKCLRADLVRDEA